MPNYLYRCDSCNAETEVYQSIKSDPLTKCEQCGGEIYRVICATPFFIDKEPTTLGHLADRNRDKMSSLERSDKGVDVKKKDTSTWFSPSGKVDMRLANLTKEQKKTYVQTGKLPDGSVDTEKVDVGRLKKDIAKLRGKE